MTISVGQAFDHLLGDEAAVRVVAWDGSVGGAEDGLTIRLHSPRALSYLVTAPGGLGLARAYLSDELSIDGMDEGNPYDELKHLRGAALTPRLPGLRDVRELVQMVRSAGVRVPDLAYHAIAPILDHGAMGLMLPRVETRVQVDEFVSFMKYPPLGVRGGTAGRGHTDYGGAEAFWQGMAGIADRDGDQRITREEFVGGAVKRLRDNPDRFAEIARPFLHAALAVADPDGAGTVAVGATARILKALGVSEDLAAELAASLDADADGRVEESEIVAAFARYFTVPE